MPLQLLASQSTLLASMAIYYVLFHLGARYLTVTSSNAIIHLSQLRELLSVFHCTLVTVLSLLTLRHYSYTMYPPAPPLRSLSPLQPHQDSDLPLISTCSETLNSLTALETGYLLADSLILYRISSQSSPPNVFPSSRGPNPNHCKDTTTTTISASKNPPKPTLLPLKALKIHHTLFLLALLTLQLYIARGRERGVLVILMFFPMNASSPLGSLRWWLVHFYHPRRRSGRRTLIALVTWLYLASYALCRVWLVGWILWVWGLQQRRMSADGEDEGTLGGGGGGGDAGPKGVVGAVAAVVDVWNVFCSLRPWCRLGTGLIWATNVCWLAWGVWRMVGRRKSKGRVDGSCSSSTTVHKDE